MPTISIEGPPIRELDTKRKLVQEVTEAATKAYALPKDVIVVVIKENAAENVGVGGRLLVDRHRQDASQSS